MSEPDKPLSIIAAIAAVMRDVPAVAKTDHNERQGFDFRGIDSVLNAVGPVLRAHGVVVVPWGEKITYTVEEVGGQRTRVGHVIVEVVYRWYAPDGSHIQARAFGQAMDTGDKSTTKAQSVAFRTMLLQTLALPTGEPDPDSETYQRSPTPAPAEAVRAEPARRPGGSLARVGEVERVADLLARIDQQSTVEGLKACWHAVKNAFQADLISSTHADRLQKHIVKRQSDLTQGATDES